MRGVPHKFGLGCIFETVGDKEGSSKAILHNFEWGTSFQRDSILARSIQFFALMHGGYVK